jgi:hypothetical protein
MPTHAKLELAFSWINIVFWKETSVYDESDFFFRMAPSIMKSLMDHTIPKV